MTNEQKAAYIIAMAACTIAEIASMQAHNKTATAGTRYGQEEFMEVIQKYGIHHNAVLTLFHG